MVAKIFRRMRYVTSKAMLTNVCARLRSQACLIGRVSASIYNFQTSLLRPSLPTSYVNYPKPKYNENIRLIIHKVQLLTLTNINYSS